MSRPAKKWKDWPMVTLEVTEEPNMVYWHPHYLEIKKYLQVNVWDSFLHVAYTTEWPMKVQTFSGKYNRKYHFCIHPMFASHFTFLSLKYDVKIEPSFNERRLRVNQYNTVMGKM